MLEAVASILIPVPILVVFNDNELDNFINSSLCKFMASERELWWI